MLVNGFKQELEQRLADIKKARVELERLFALRIDDAEIDTPEQAQNKEDCMKAIRSAEGAFTSYAGSVRSIKGVLDTYLHVIILGGLMVRTFGFKSPTKHYNKSYLNARFNQHGE